MKRNPPFIVSLLFLVCTFSGPFAVWISSPALTVPLLCLIVVGIIGSIGLIFIAINNYRQNDKLKSHFPAGISNEIYTTMNVIVELSETELRKDIPEAAKDAYTKISYAAKDLLHIINNTLDLTIIESQKVILINDSFELEEVLSNALLVASLRLDGKNAELILNPSVDLPRFIIGDRTKLWQIFKSLLDNSAKFMETGRIVLTVYPDKEKSDNETVYITFIIKDTRAGIKDDLIPKTGPGIAISKQLCEMMGGIFTIESHVSSGTIICMNIPFKRTTDTESGSVVQALPSLEDLNILVVDDDDLSLTIINSLLTAAGAKCELAHNCDEAMQSGHTAFDLVISDYVTTGVDGLKTVRRVQSVLPKIPMLLMATAYQRAYIKDELDRSLIDDVIEKPFVPSQFISKIRAAVGFSSHQAKQQNIYTRFKDAHALLCEDDGLHQEITSGMMAQFGVTATLAENGCQCIELLNNGKTFDIIFINMQMPVMDGYEATRIIRDDYRFDHIPIISLSADTMKEIADKCMEMGINAHISKPIDIDTLHKIFLKWLPVEKRIKRETFSFFHLADILTAETLLRFGGDASLYEKSLKEFALDLPDIWPDFDNSSTDSVSMQLFVHKVKDAACNLTENTLYLLAAALESSLRSGKPDRKLYERLVKASGLFKKRVVNFITSGISRPTVTGTQDELVERLVVLREALQSFDLINCRKAVEALDEKRWNVIDGSKLYELRELTLDYEYDNALELLDTISEHLKA